MADVLILDWLEEYESLTESEIHTYSTEQEQNYEVMKALYAFLEDPNKSKVENFLDRVCQQLFSFYRSGEQNLKYFTMQYIPSLVLLNLANTKGFPSVGTLLLSIYNLEVVDNKGQSHIISFRVPSIAQSSIYHDSSNLEPAFIAENALRRWEECNSKLVNWGPLPQVENLNAQNRQRVVTALMFLYNQHIGKIFVDCLEYGCRTISRLVSQGFASSGSSRASVDSDSSYNSISHRLIVSSPLLLEFLHVIYHCVVRGVNESTHTFHEVTRRGIYECYPDVLLVSHAIQNLFHRSPSVPVAAPQPHVVSKSMITNASFRTKKLPDDIPIQADESAEGVLSSITEEQEDNEKTRTRSGSSALKHLPKLPGLNKKPKVIKNSPTPQRNSLGSESIEMHYGSGDRVSVAFTDGTSDDVPQPLHVSAV
ncbi:hypothetical protein PPYR_09540 [Photinus pyralis]|uniref:Hyccin n=1 Tax=Photinus pyralis TaxID=7054 RepID=A0A5N4AMJ9_PHOPY|nr:hyccin isoform X1 [Photinus pyralis]XP_031343220.1 hyccin isoform X1 [Photinus pyralis]KAB0798547.1 hypothetical protein PPYR_09540 [Photinus pyralis]